MTNIKNVTIIGSMAFPAQGEHAHSSVVVDVDGNDNVQLYALRPGHGPTHVITPSGAAFLVMELARDLYEAGHITPGEITDHMLRDTED